MAQFSVKTKNARIQTAEEERLAKELGQIADEVSSIGNNLGFRVASKANIRARINHAAGHVEAHKGSMSGMKSALGDILDAYDKAERQIVDNAQVKNAGLSDAQGTHFDFGNLEESIIKNLIGPLLTDIDGGEYKEYILKRLEDIQDFAAKIYNGDPSVISSLLMMPSLILNDIDAFQNFVDNLKDGIQDKIKDVTSFDFDKKVQGALYDKQITAEHGSLGVSISAYDAYASAEGGLFTEDEDGNLVFNPNIDAKMGASYTLLTAAGDIAVGNEMMGAHANGNITVGHVAGEASLHASLMDEDGAFNPSANVHAGMEAVLVEAEAQAGVTVLGTDVNVSGSAYVGLGAHADFDIGDGKIKCDIGAALGVGFSIGFEIDYGGTVDAIKKGAKSVLRKIWPW
jgi:hypothetical protein